MTLPDIIRADGGPVFNRVLRKLTMDAIEDGSVAAVGAIAQKAWDSLMDIPTGASNYHTALFIAMNLVQAQHVFEQTGADLVEREGRDPETDILSLILTLKRRMEMAKDYQQSKAGMS